MTLTLNIDENLIQEAQSIGNHQTEQAAITEALKEYIRYHKQLHHFATLLLCKDFLDLSKERKYVFVDVAIHEQP